MNKTTKRTLKWLAGLALSVLLLWQLYRQIQAQLASGLTFVWWPRSGAGYFIAALLFLPLNIAIEAFKWQRLVQTAQRLRFSAALRSVLSGIAGSIITPNRIGEYPARIIALKQPKNSRLISVSVFGACAQFLSLLIAGIFSIGYYWYQHPEWVYGLILSLNILVTILAALIYFSFERWAPWIERFRLFARMKLWARLLRRFSTREEWMILGLSLLRFSVYCLQFWLMLRWQGIALSPAGGFLTCALFFWAMAVIPSISLAELGVRGTLSAFLFGPYSGNTAGILAATFALWCLNLVLPSLLGTLLFMPRLRSPKGKVGNDI